MACLPALGAPGGAAAETPAEIPFQFRDGLLWVDVAVPQTNQPLHFLLDTGSGMSAIDLTTAKQIGLKPGRPVQVHGVHSTLTGYWQSNLQAKLGTSTLPDEYLAIDLDKLSHSCAQRVDGLVGADFFRGRVVQIDFEHQQIRIREARAAGETAPSVPLELRYCGMRVPITVNGHRKQWVRMDTGCATALQWVTSEVPFDQCPRQMAVGLTEVSIPQATTQVRIAEERFEQVPTGLHTTAIFAGEAGLLGNGLLSQFSTITIDAKANRLFLGPRRSPVRQAPLSKN